MVDVDSVDWSGALDMGEGGKLLWGARGNAKQGLAGFAAP
jgi:hypothetical protein